jgi:membrane protein YdbS with pleckstrin-like domain
MLNRMTKESQHPLRGVSGETLESLDPAWPRAERLVWFIVDAVLLAPSLAGLVITGVIGVNLWLLGVLGLAWVVAALALAWGTLVMPGIAYRHAGVGVGDLGFEHRRGVWWQKTTIVPWSRVQHTDVTQGPIMRRFGLGKLVIHTAGTRNSVVEVPGLDYDNAKRIRDQLLAHCGPTERAQPRGVRASTPGPEPVTHPADKEPASGSADGGSELDPEQNGG